jgi:hypothetical protein
VRKKEGLMKNQRQHVRRPVEEGDKLTLTIIPFEKEEIRDIMADATDIGAGGLGITARCALEPGYVIMKDGEGEYANGVLLWSQALDDMTCRAGIQFLSRRRKAA